MFFQEWKIVDEKKLAGRLRHALKGLEQAEKSLKDEDSESKMRKELVHQQKRLRAKLEQIAGVQEVEAHDQEQREAEASKMVVPAITAANVAKTNGLSLESGSAGQSSAQPGQVGGMTNEQLAHELLIDGDFRLDDKVGVCNDRTVSHQSFLSEKQWRAVVWRNCSSRMSYILTASAGRSGGPLE